MEDWGLSAAARFNILTESKAAEATQWKILSYRILHEYAVSPTPMAIECMLLATSSYCRGLDVKPPEYLQNGHESPFCFPMLLLSGSSSPVL
ncbi:hypothetical protein A6R68_00622 [Neotoma lepida]|uniref:Uncharacterized protein n=1 Tax=Neotoma lepida TaxID=56216 RepID=A0A1A6GZ16_NEOLE|nr:hypothetical protein A6R68_00622 [Neotoma lepida]